jgi:hypothetical protein
VAWRNAGSGAIYVVETDTTTSADDDTSCTKTLISHPIGSSYRTTSFDVGGTVTRLPAQCTKNDHVFVTVTGCGETATCKISLDQPELLDFMKNGHQHGWVPIKSELVAGKFVGRTGCDYMWTGAGGSSNPCGSFVVRTMTTTSVVTWW